MGRRSSRPTSTTFRWVGESATVNNFRIGDGNDEISFYGATPVAQPASADQAAMAAYGTGAFGLDSDANMQAMYDLLAEMRLVLVNSGLMKGSA